jgi:hypothetical protein
VHSPAPSASIKLFASPPVQSDSSLSFKLVLQPLAASVVGLDFALRFRLAMHMSWGLQVHLAAKAVDEHARLPLEAATLYGSRGHL